MTQALSVERPGARPTPRPRTASAARRRGHDLAGLGADVLQRPVRRVLHHPRPRRDVAAAWRASTSTTSRPGSSASILLVSSPTFQIGVWAQERGERRKAVKWIVTSFLLGAAFLGNTLYEWHDFAGSHHGPALNAYWSLFFIMTGIHGLHVALGSGGHDLPPGPHGWKGR